MTSLRSCGMSIAGFLLGTAWSSTATRTRAGVRSSVRVSARRRCQAVGGPCRHARLCTVRPARRARPPSDGPTVCTFRTIRAWPSPSRTSSASPGMPLRLLAGEGRHGRAGPVGARVRAGGPHAVAQGRRADPHHRHGRRHDAGQAARLREAPRRRPGWPGSASAWGSATTKTPKAARHRGGGRRASRCSRSRTRCRSSRSPRPSSRGSWPSSTTRCSARSTPSTCSPAR